MVPHPIKCMNKDGTVPTKNLGPKNSGLVGTVPSLALYPIGWTPNYCRAPHTHGTDPTVLKFFRTKKFVGSVPCVLSPCASQPTTVEAVDDISRPMLTSAGSVLFSKNIIL